MPSDDAETPDPIKLGDPELSDVTLTVENQDFLAHKMILGSRSDYFKAMFYGQFKEANMSRIEVKDVSIDTFRRLLELLYTGKVSDENQFLTNIKKINEQIFLHDDTMEHYEIVCHSVPQLPFSTNFWKCTEELLAVADRYCLSNIGKDYIKQKLTDELCSDKKCSYCFDHWIFAQKHNIEVPHNQRTFALKAYQIWTERMENEKQQSGQPQMDVSMLTKIFRKVKLF